eukprot:484307_1
MSNTLLPKSFSSSPVKQSSPPSIRIHPFLPATKSTSSPLQSRCIPQSSTYNNPHPLLMPKPSIMPISSTYKSTTKSKSLTPTPKSFVRLQPKSFSTFSTKKQFTTSNHTIPISSLITQDGTLKTHKQSIYITKHNSQRDSLSPSQSPAINTPQSDTLQSNSHSDSDSDSDIEVLHTPQSPTPQPLSFWNKNRNSYNSYNSNIFKKRFNRNYEPLQPATKKRKLNNNSNNEPDAIDLCDSSDDDTIISNGYSHIDNPKTIQIIKDVCDNNTPTSNIDNDDKEVLLYGISIGTHSHHWIPNSQCNNRPKIIFNQYKDSMDIYLNSTNNDYVPVTINAKNVGNLIIPNDPSYFTYKEAVGQYINVIFLVLKEPLIAYKWLQEHFCPKNIYFDAKSSSQAFITIYIDAQSLNQLQSIILKKHPCSLVDRFVAKLNNEDKYEILRLTPPITSAIYDRWKQINEQKIHENETGLSEIESENENENDNERENKQKLNENLLAYLEAHSLDVQNVIDALKNRPKPVKLSELSMIPAEELTDYMKNDLKIDTIQRVRFRQMIKEYKEYYKQCLENL